MLTVGEGGPPLCFMFFIWQLACALFLRYNGEIAAAVTLPPSLIHRLQECKWISSTVWKLGLIRVALLLYPPPTRPLGPLPDPYPIPRGYLIPTGQKIKQKSLLWHKNLKKRPNFLSPCEQLN